MRKNLQKNKGFVILFAVTLSAILLSIALGVANIAQKEIRFGTSARDTNNAFFAADTGIECALVYDKSSSSSFPAAGPASDINCASTVFRPTFTGTSNTGLYNFTITNLVGTSCTKVSVFKDNTNPLSINTTIIAKGYNNGGNVAGLCNPPSNSLERELKTSYSTGPGISTPVAQNVTWKNIVGVSTAGSNLAKTASDAWGNAGASSVQSISSDDGYVEFSTNENNLGKMGGLNNGDVDQNYTSIDFALNTDVTGGITIYENGTAVASLVSTYVAGDIFRVSVESGVVKYYKNGGLLYTSAQAPTYPLVFDTALKQPGSTIINAKITGN